uniref:Uncharacterized protein n=1 Tax=Coccidioides posadasii RMSCC 3488 TaxID=454284 RepID=A0A0J6F4D5_COCPO|nr:hypothetical protein CPAG_04110 [Coccidioides posadasii RMSCC 3488]
MWLRSTQDPTKKAKTLEEEKRRIAPGGSTRVILFKIDHSIEGATSKVKAQWLIANCIADHKRPVSCTPVRRLRFVEAHIMQAPTLERRLRSPAEFGWGSQFNPKVGFQLGAPAIERKSATEPRR